jgi:hypothetical protein
MNGRQTITSHTKWDEQFRRVGWFIPPYASTGWIHSVSALIERSGSTFDQTHLQEVLARLFTPDIVSTMVLNRYPHTPVIMDYQEIIAESAEAHFLKLDHIAATGLVPVVEGVGRKLAKVNGVEHDHVKTTFYNLAEHCRTRVVDCQIGGVPEIMSMLDSFTFFTKEFLFSRSDKYLLDDGTNRNGLAHGAFSDSDFGSPLNFYKIMSAINFLTFISALYHGGSGFVPDHTANSQALATHYDRLSKIAETKPAGSVK